MRMVVSLLSNRRASANLQSDAFLPLKIGNDFKEITGREGPCVRWRTHTELIADRNGGVKIYSVSGRLMKKRKPDLNSGIRPEYDFTKMKGGVRGKYVKRFREGTNIVLLEPDVAVAFPNEAAVNEALRGVLNTTCAVRLTGGLANKALQPASERPKKAKVRHPARG